MSIFMKIKKRLSVSLFALLLGISPYTLCEKYFYAVASTVDPSLGENIRAITGVQYMGQTGDGRVKFMIDYWQGLDHRQAVWISSERTCPEYTNDIRKIEAYLKGWQEKGFVDGNVNIWDIIASDDQSFYGPRYPSEKFWNHINALLRPGKEPLPWPGKNPGGIQDPVVSVDPVIDPSPSDPGNGGGGESGNITDPGNGGGESGNPTDSGNGGNEAGNPDAGNGDANKDYAKKQLRNMAEMYAYSLLGEFIGHVSVGLYEEFSTKDPKKLLENWNKHSLLLEFNVRNGKNEFKLYKRIMKVQKAVTDEILSYYRSSEYINTILISLMNVYTMSLKDLAENGGKNKIEIITGMSSYVANSICQWVDNLDIGAADKKLKIRREVLLTSLKARTKKVMESLVKGYAMVKSVQLTYKCTNKTVNVIVGKRINEMISVINASKSYGKKLDIINFVSRVSRVIAKSFTKVSVVTGASFMAKFIVNPAKFFRELKADRGISDINPKLGHVAARQGIFHFGSIIGTAGAVGVVAGMTGQLWLVAIPTCANVIIDYVVSKTNATTMMKKLLAEVSESDAYTYEQQKILREYLKIASNKLNTVKNRITSIGIKKEVLGRMVTQLFNLLEGGELACINDNGWKNFREKGTVDESSVKTIVPAKSYSSYYITQAFIKATAEIYLATKAEVNTDKNYKDKDANDITQQHKVKYLQEFFKIMSDIYHYMRYAGIMDLYYNQNYAQDNEGNKTGFFTKIKRALNKNDNKVTTKDVSYFLKSLYEFVIQAKNESDKFENDGNDPNSMVLKDLKQRSGEFGAVMLFRNLVNTFSLLCDDVKKNKYQKVMDIIPYVQEKNIVKYTKEDYSKLDKREIALRAFLERDAILRLSRVKPKTAIKKTTGKVAKVKS